MGRAPIAGASCLPPCFDPHEGRSGALRAVKANTYDLRPRMLGHPFQHLERLRREAGTAVDAGDQKRGDTERPFCSVEPIDQALDHLRVSRPIGRVIVWIEEDFGMADVPLALQS